MRNLNKGKTKLKIKSFDNINQELGHEDLLRLKVVSDVPQEDWTATDRFVWCEIDNNLS